VVDDAPATQIVVATRTPSDSVPSARTCSPTARAAEVVGPSGFTKVVEELNWTVAVPLAVSTTMVSPEMEVTVPSTTVDPEVVDPEVVDPELVDPELVDDPEVVDDPPPGGVDDDPPVDEPEGPEPLVVGGPLPAPDGWPPDGWSPEEWSPDDWLLPEAVFPPLPEPEPVAAAGEEPPVELAALDPGGGGGGGPMCTATASRPVSALEAKVPRTPTAAPFTTSV